MRDAFVFERLVERKYEIPGLTGLAQVPAGDFLRNYIDKRE